MIKVLAAAVCGLGLASAPSYAVFPVEDYAALLRWVEQAKSMQAQYETLQGQLNTLRNVPSNLENMAQGLLTNAVRNPLGFIQQNLNVLQSGRGPGNCNGAQDFLTQNRYVSVVGGDFLGQWINRSANRTAGVQACTSQMMLATQSRLDKMTELMDQLQNAHDVTEVSAISARIQYENSTISAQQQQITLMAQTAALQNQNAENQIMQKQRADAEEVMRNTSPNGSVGGIVNSAVPSPKLFSAQ